MWYGNKILEEATEQISVYVSLDLVENISNVTGYEKIQDSSNCSTNLHVFRSSYLFCFPNKKTFFLVYSWEKCFKLIFTNWTIALFFLNWNRSLDWPGRPTEGHTGGGLCCHFWRQTSPLPPLSLSDSPAVVPAEQWWQHGSWLAEWADIFFSQSEIFLFFWENFTISQYLTLTYEY